jgi:hypothetical protein
MNDLQQTIVELIEVANRLGVAAASVRLASVQSRATTFTVLVIGEFKQGKSELVCALAGAPVSPSHVRLPTGPVVTARHGDKDAAVVSGIAGDEQTIALADVSATIYGNDVTSDGCAVVDVTATNWNLPDGVVIVDTPGGGLTSPAGVIVRKVAATCNAVLFATGAGRELTADEIAVLESLHGEGPLLCVLTKVDLYPNWRKVMAVDVEHLMAAVGSIEVVPVAPPLYAYAAVEPALAEESGIPAVRRWISAMSDQAQAAQDLPLRRTALEIIGELEVMAINELDALDPERREDGRRRLLAAKVAAERVLSGESLWLVELRDGMNEVDRRLERGLDRLRHDLSRRASDLIAESDPAKNWDEFGTEFMNAVVEASTVLYSDLTRELERAVQVAIKQFAVKAGEVVLELHDDALLALPEAELVKARRQPLPLLDVADASWSRVETLQVIGMQARLTSPFGLLIAVLLGRRILRAKRSELLEGRRQQARQAVNDYLDELVLQQRELMEGELKVIHDRVRDQLIAQARQAVDGWDEALRELDAHATLDDSERAERTGVLRDMNVTLERLRTELADVDLPAPL